jgi:hypothetical protein
MPHLSLGFASLLALGLYLGIEGFLLSDEIVGWFFGLENPKIRAVME